MIDPYEIFVRAIDVHRRLLAAGIDNAIGGALALGYHIDDPRGTQDIDINVSLPAARAREALRSLPPDVPWDEATITQIVRDDQVRIMWPVTDDLPIPLDLFFAVHALHEVVRTRTIEVPMHGATVKVLSATDLTIFKALYNRSKDWPDIEAMLAAHDSTVDLDEAIRCVGEVVGGDDHRTHRLRGLLRR
ncbi:hypothetical protein [Nocardioides sp. BYT-33-1]|uniref:hypothetical protein n=1 Tax=Nocardioides sp. BYT-33-1 TaxID=3416952 RepID=UPI003F535443